MPKKYGYCITFLINDNDKIVFLIKILITQFEIRY